MYMYLTVWSASGLATEQLRHADAWWSRSPLIPPVSQDCSGNTGHNTVLFATLEVMATQHWESW